MVKLNWQSSFCLLLRKNIVESLKNDYSDVDANSISHHLLEIYSELDSLCESYKKLTQTSDEQARKDIDSIFGHWNYHLSELKKLDFGVLITDD